jgi:hypothetical protein
MKPLKTPQTDKQCDMFNAILIASEMTFHKLLKHAAAFWRKLLKAVSFSSLRARALACQAEALAKVGGGDAGRE